MQPIIGITMCFDSNDLINTGVEYNYVRREYSIALQKAGAQPLFLDPSIDPLVAAQLCDGIVISGGEDIDPTLYGQSAAGMKQQEPRVRTDWERQLIDACDEWNRPILGICYGEQLLNVHYGGTLHQDIATNLDSTLDHGTSGAAAYHEVVFEQDFLGYKKGDRTVVAARHHQSINKIAPGFDVVARSSDGGIEAVAGRGHVGVQWHAESDDTAAKVYGAFVTGCLQRKQPAKAMRVFPQSKRLSAIIARFSK
jgi:putative glutamine amidotransferase